MAKEITEKDFEETIKETVEDAMEGFVYIEKSTHKCFQLAQQMCTDRVKLLKRKNNGLQILVQKLEIDIKNLSSQLEARTFAELQTEFGKKNLKLTEELAQLKSTKTDAVEFAEWILQSGYSAKHSTSFLHWFNINESPQTTKELYQLFKKHD